MSVRMTAKISTCHCELSCAICFAHQAAGQEFLLVGPTRYGDDGYVVCFGCTENIPPFSYALLKLHAQEQEQKNGVSA